MAVLLPPPKFSALSSAGALLSGGLLYSYAAGTNTPLATYTDAGGATANANPVVLDARGEANVWLSSGLLYKFVLKTSAGVTLWTVDNVRGVEDASDNEVRSVTDYGASTTNTGAQNKVAIQAALDDLEHNDSLYFPATPGTWYEINGTLLIPSKSGITLFGDGKLASRLRLIGGTSSTDMFARSDTSALEANNINHVTFRGLGMEAIGSSRHCINWLSMSRSSFDDLYIGGFGGAAIKMQSSIVVFGRNFVIQGCQNGVLQDTTGWAGLNGLSLTDFYIASCTQRGIDLQSGLWKFTLSGVIESCALGGISLGQDCYDGEIHLYGEENVSAAANCEDIYIGKTSLCGNIRVRGYFNGNTSATDFHYPVRMKYARNCTIYPSTLTQGSKFLKLEAGGSLSGNTIHAPTMVGGTYVAPNGNQATYSFGADVLELFVYSNNTLIDAVNAPFDRHNLIKERLPYGWTLSLAGGSTIAKSDRDVMGLYGVRMTRGTDACQLARTYTLPIGYAGKFAVFVVPVQARTADKQLTITVTPNGTGAVTGSFTLSPALATEVMFPVTVFLPSDATTVALTVTASSNSLDDDIGHPCFYRGLQPWYGVGGVYDYWLDTAAPTTGTWADGDRVRNSAPAAGGVPGWVVTTPGAAGVFVFKAEAALAA